MVFLKPFSGGGDDDNIAIRICLNDPFNLLILFGIRHGGPAKLYNFTHLPSVLQDSGHKQFFSCLRFCNGMCFHNRNGFGDKAFSASDDL